MVWYNVENLMDTLDDPYTADEEFTPKGVKEWDSQRYYTKLRLLAKVLASVGAVDSIDAIGLCEIENAEVLADLLNRVPLSDKKWWVIHRDSPDRRGIDVAVLYRPDRIRVLRWDWVLPSVGFVTREALWVVFQSIHSPEDSLRVGWVHLPSQRSGDHFTRARAWKSITAQTPAMDLWMGDFNEESRGPLGQAMSAQGWTFLPVRSGMAPGTYWYKDRWSRLDQAWVCQGRQGYQKTTGESWIAKRSRTQSQRPRRTYEGLRYLGGPSDHLPLYVFILSFHH